MRGRSRSTCPETAARGCRSPRGAPERTRTTMPAGPTRGHRGRPTKFAARSLRLRSDCGDPGLSEHAFFVPAPVAKDRRRSRIAVPLELRCQILADEFKRWIAFVARRSPDCLATGGGQVEREFSPCAYVAAVPGL